MPARPKPKTPRNLRLAVVDGKPQSASGSQIAPVVDIALADLPPAPTWLPESAHAVWDQTVRWMIGQRTWLPSYEPAAAAFASLYSEFMENPKGMQTSRVIQMRLYAGDLGFSPSHVDRVRRE